MIRLSIGAKNGYFMFCDGRHVLRLTYRSSWKLLMPCSASGSCSTMIAVNPPADEFNLR